MNINKSLKNNINLSFIHLLRFKYQPLKPYFNGSSKVLKLFIGLSKILRSLHIKNYSSNAKKDLSTWFMNTKFTFQ